MEEKKNAQGFIGDVDDYMKSLDSASMAGFSAFLSEASDSTLSESERLSKLADYYEGEYRRISDESRALAQRADAMGDMQRAAVWYSASDQVREWADQRAHQSDEAWMRSTHLEISGRVSGVLGPAGNVIDAGQVISAVAQADWEEASKNTSSVLLSLAGAKSAALLGTAVSLPVLPKAMMVAGFAAAGAWLGDKYGGSVYEELRTSATDVLEELGGPAGVLDSAWDFWVGDLIGDVRDYFNRGESHASPIILDLDSNGISTLGLDAGVQFDHNGDGFAQATGWVGPEDALLAMDLTGNEEIETGSELFGNASEIEDGVTAMNGFEALAIHDTNGNGRIDPGDEAWDDLRLWQDANGNGEVDDGELLTLDQVGIGSIDLGYSDSTYVDEHGNEHRQIGRFEWADGREGEATDVWFIQDTAHTEARERLDVPEDIAVLPDLMGYGEVHDLHQALVRDDSGQLREQVEAFIAETDVKAREARMENLLYEWAGVSDVDPESRGRHIDGRKVATLEAFLGRDFRQHGSPDPRIMASGELRAGFDILQTTMYGQMMRQTHLAPYLEGMDLVFDEDGIRIDFAGTTEALNQQFDADPARGVADLLELQRATGEQLSPMGFDSHGLLRDWLAQAGDDPAVQDALADFGWDGVRADGEGTAASEIVFGGNDGAELTAGSGGDWLLGGDGDDVLQAGSGNDILYGGGGDNTYRFDVGQGHNTIIEMHGDEGHSVLEFGPEIRAGDLDIRAEGSSLVLAHSNGRDSITIENWFGSADAERHRINTLRFADGHSFDLSLLQLGSTEGDELTGGEENAILVGNEGENTLTGGAGDNWLHGGRDADVLVGGEGDNLFVVRHRDDQVIAESGDGTNTVQSHVSFTLSDNLHSLTLLGRSGISATGNELDNVLIGNSGNNRLDGVAGANTMIGGRGNNTYVVHSTDDVVIEQPGEGNDTVESHIDYVLPDNVENLHLQGSEDLDGTGNELNNELIGNTGDNVLHGVAGNNYIDGRGGANIMIGGTGEDTYVVRSDEDVVIEQPGEGNDTVHSYIDYVLPENVNNLTLMGSDDLEGTGNTLDNVIIGNTGDNVLNGVEGDNYIDGRAGANIMIGGAGDDIYVVNSEDDVVIEQPGEGHDTIRSSVTYALPDNVEDLILTGSADIDGTGNELDNYIEGNNGDNVLNGVAGANVMAGGRGDNTYILNSEDDVVIEKPNQGTDTVISPFDYTLPDNVENLTLVGDARVGRGNEEDNIIIGTERPSHLYGVSGDNVLIGGGRSANFLYGGDGDNTYVVSNPGTKVIAQENGGTDTVKAETHFRLPDHVENLTLTGDGDYWGRGNELDNTLIGNDGDNTLRGEGGDNFIHGGRGSNVLYGGEGSDTYYFERGDGHDRIVENARDPGEDVLLLGEEIAADQLWFSQDRRDLSIEVIGTDDRITVDDWFGRHGEPLDRVELSSGEVLTAAEVNNLVQAMAAFDPPGADETGLPKDYRDTLDPVVAAAWQ